MYGFACGHFDHWNKTLLEFFGLVLLINDVVDSLVASVWGGSFWKRVRWYYQV